MEQWKKIADSATYEVSTEGRVRNAKTGQLFGITNLGGSGYVQVTMKGDIGKTRMVHRLVALAFLCNPEGKRTVNHINGVKTDNRLENLEWATYSENSQHMYDTGLKAYRPLHYKGKFGVEHNRSKSVVRFDAMGKEVGVFGSLSEATRLTGVSTSTVCWLCKSGKISRTGFGFRYLETT